MKTICLIFGFFLIFYPTQTYAKRIAPPQVPPLSFKGLMVKAPNNDGRVGRIEVWDKSNKKVWEREIYSVQINPLEEEDVQWVFITSLKEKDGKVIVLDERGRQYSVVIPRNLEALYLTKEECATLNGNWGRWGLGPERCNLRTDDKGNVCQDARDCHGHCIAELTPEQKAQIVNGQALIISGRCSEFAMNFGCHPFVENGKVEAIMCAD
ncbi:MAG: hypothetical protein Q8Q08_00060 [Candidatus Omnitrophota bacterium]|nr:hypothetical protein [Candidatus Omnitrophota bacterium]MDZ4342468.1 hypothetical protein [Candidatus Binatia bacterium]